MSSNKADLDELEIVKCEINDIDELMSLHIESLSQPMDSWLEDRLMESVLYKIVFKNCKIGYIGRIEDTLEFFYVKKEHFRYAALILEKFILENAIKKVFIITQDSLLCALISEWDYEKEKQACWFTDSGSVNNSVKPQVKYSALRVAIDKDAQRIRAISGDFFDEVSGGFACLEERIAVETIYILEEHENLLGCGVLEKSQFGANSVSIGMYVNRDYRRKGVARTILLHLKEWAIDNNLMPIAGCWYYNTLSRKSLESAGMIATAMGYEAVLKAKEKLPLRTGNPPGELVKDKGN